MLKAENSCGADKLLFLTSDSRCRFSSAFPVCSGAFQARIADTGTDSSDISLRYSGKVPPLRRHGRHWAGEPVISLYNLQLSFAVCGTRCRFPTEYGADVKDICRGKGISESSDAYLPYFHWKTSGGNCECCRAHGISF